MRCYATARMTHQAKFAGPVQPGEVQLSTRTELVHIHADTDTQHRISRLACDLQPALALESAPQDLVEQRLGLVLVRLLSKRKLAHEDLPGLGQHALLAGG